MDSGRKNYGVKAPVLRRSSQSTMSQMAGNFALSSTIAERDSGETETGQTRTGSSILVNIKYGNSKILPVNPNSGLAAGIDYVRSVLYFAEKEHIELCDEGGKLINPDDFPPMMLLSAFLKPGADDAFLLPFRVERDTNRQILSVEALLNDADRLEPEIMAKLKKANHVPREKKTPRGESAHGVRHAHISHHEEGPSLANATSTDSTHLKKDSKKTNSTKATK